MTGTPRTLVDERVLQANVDRMAALAATAGVALRPHVKTHKSVEIARRQRAAGAAGITVATLGEAEVFVNAGFDDVFVAYPLWLTPDRAERLAALTGRARIVVGCDSLESGRQLAALPRDRRPEVLVEVDSGHHRTGVDPTAAGPLAAALAAAGVPVLGVFTFPGHAYSPQDRAAAVVAERDALAAAAEALRRHGVEPVVVSGGSTPSVELIAGTDPEPLTELRPGVYVFHDAQQWELGVCTPDRIALLVEATVVSRRTGTVVLDAGSKVLGADRPAWATGHGRVPAEPRARVVQLSEHHAVLSWPESEPLPELGSRLLVAPNHVCSAVNLVDELVPVRDGETGVPWPVDARGRND